MQKKQEEINQSTSAAERAIEKLQSNNDLIKVREMIHLNV